jgi:sugar/nucleoside kinase (ribokinase family)
VSRPFDVCGLGNAIVDIFLEVSDDEFAALGFKRGGSQLVDAAEQKAVLDRFRDRDPRLVSGGSVANSIIGLSQLGGRAAFIGCVGDDRYGLFYKTEFDELDIDFGNPVVVGAATGTCLVLITPDAERTMRTCLAVSSHVGARHVDEGRIKESQWLFVEGYVFANPQAGHGAVREALRLARRHGTKVAVTCSDAWVIGNFGDVFRETLSQTDLLFCNTEEARALTGAAGAEDAFAQLRDVVPSAVVTNGPGGAYVRHGGAEAHVPAFPCEPRDLTGAGDMFAGAFLYGITHGVPPGRAARAACFLAMKVITQVGARLHQGTRRWWDEVLAAT